MGHYCFLIDTDINAAQAPRIERLMPNNCVNTNVYGTAPLQLAVRCQQFVDVHCGEQLSIAGSFRLDQSTQLIKRLALPRDKPISPAQLVGAAWRAWGEKSLDYLQGDFAFGVWDARSKTLFAAKDVMGACPLYYAKMGNQFLLASSPLIPLKHPNYRLELDRTAALICLYSGIDESRSLLKGIRSLKRAQLLSFSDNQLKIRRYWEFNQSNSIRYPDQRQYIDHCQDILQQCVHDRIAGECAIATTLSGGLDSTTITAIATQQLESKSLQPYPISFRFQSLLDCDESTHSRQVADHLKLQTHWLDCENHWLFKDTGDTQTQKETPFQCWETLETSMIDQCTRAGNTVLLTGHGGDSLFTGPWQSDYWAATLASGKLSCFANFHNSLKSDHIGLLKGIYSRLLFPALGSRLQVAIRRLRKQLPSDYAWQNSQEFLRNNDALSYFLPEDTCFENPVSQLLWQEMIADSGGIRRVIHYYYGLSKNRGLKILHPFYDRRLAEFMLAIPPSLISENSLDKGFLRKVSADWLPQTIINNPIKPDLRSYYFYGIQQEIKQIRALFTNSYLSQLGLIDESALHNRLSEFLNTPAKRSFADFIPAIQLELWMKPIFD